MPSRLTVMLASLLLVTPVVLFWLWLVIVGARVATSCPEGCECDRSYSVGCYDLSITAVPLIRVTGVKELMLLFSNIKLIERNSFVELTELKRLNIQLCGVRAIELGAFNRLTELRELRIVGNEISEIIPGVFESLSNLEHLHLSYNELQNLDSDVFSGLVNLRYIDLSANNLQYLHPDTFLGLPNINHIYLSYNFDLQIPTKRNFITSQSLSKLDISYCNVSSLSGETFTNVSGLEWLELNNNNLRTVDINILTALPKLSTLYLYGNPLQCDCQLQEVWRLCEDRNITTVYREDVPQCDTPSEVKGLWWRVLEKGECLEGNVQYYGDYRNTSYSSTDIDDTYTETDTEKGTDIQTDTDTDLGTATDMETFYVDILTKYQVPIFAVPFIFGTTSNVILLIIIICNKDMRTVPNMYIINLAISDIIYLTVLFYEACTNTISDTWIQGDFMCRLIPFCRRMSVCLLAYSVAVFAVQGYRVIANPLPVHVSSPQTWRVTVATVCGLWIVAALFAVPSAISEVWCTHFSILYHMEYYQNVVIFELLAFCVIPLCAIVFTHIMTARHLVESSRPISDGTENPQLQTRRNTARIVAGLTVVFLISFLPYHALWAYVIYVDTEEIKNDTAGLINLSYKHFLYIYLISTYFLTINPCLNPVALFCTSSQFRQHLKRYLTCFCKTNFPPTNIELERRS